MIYDNVSGQTLIDIIQNDCRDIISAVDLSPLAGRSVLITGSSGLLGVYFLACLQHLHTIGLGPKKVTAVMQSKPSAYLSHFLNYPACSVMFGDLADIDFCRSLPKADYVLHAAGYGQPGRFMENPVKTLRLNTLATHMLFDCLQPGGSFLFLSTAEVYSGLSGHPHREAEIGTTNTTHVRSCYIEAKRCGEAICNAYRQQGVKANSARLALAYGPGTRPGDRRVLNAFIERGMNGAIALMDMGLAKRTYCYVADAIEIMWHILLHGQEPIYNVGGVSRTTISGLAESIGSLMNVPVIFPESSQDLTGAPDDVQLDLSLVKSEFGKSKFVSLEEGLKRTITWQKALYREALVEGR